MYGNFNVKFEVMRGFVGAIVLSVLLAGDLYGFYDWHLPDAIIMGLVYIVLFRKRGVFNGIAR